MIPPKWECERCHKFVEQLSYCSECWKVVCEECYDEFVGTCIDCIKKLFDGTIAEETKMATKDTKDIKVFPELTQTLILKDTFEQIRERTLAEREKNYRLARESKHCPKCKDKVNLIELADGSLFCPKCNSIFTPHDNTLGTPLGRRPAGKDQWDGTIDNIERIVEKDKW